MWIFLGVLAAVAGWLVLNGFFAAPHQRSDTLPRAAPEDPVAKTPKLSLPAETETRTPSAPPESIEPGAPEKTAPKQPSPPPRPGLKIELIPRQMAGMNARAVLTRDAWDEVRRIVHTRHGWSCAECHSEKKLECHEVWEYGWARRHAKNVPVMRLVGLQTLCRRCHQGKHIKFVESHEADELPVVRAHLMSVHGLTEAQLDQHVRRAVTKVNGLTYAYRLDLSYLNDQRFAPVHQLMARTFGENENRHCRKGKQGEPLPAS